MAFNYSPKIVTDGLVFYLDAANTKSYVSGSTSWYDLSVNDNNGTLINGPTFNSGNGGSIVLDGIDDYCSTTFSQNFSTNDFTLDCWVYPEFDSITYGRPIIAKNGTGNGCSVYDFALEYGRQSNKFSIIADGASGPKLLYTTNTYIKNKWYNIVATRKNIGINNYLVTLYVNGTSENSTTSNFVGGNGSNLIIGKFLGCALINEWLGKISITKIYNRELTADEVLQNYNTTKTRFDL